MKKRKDNDDFKLPSGCKKIPVTDEWMISFVIEMPKDEGTCRINVWRNSRNDYFTVGTCLNHPKQGRTQLFRKFCDKEEVEEILSNPRIHTGKGYYES